MSSKSYPYECMDYYESESGFERKTITSSSPGHAARKYIEGMVEDAEAGDLFTVLVKPPAGDVVMIEVEATRVNISFVSQQAEADETQEELLQMFTTPAE